LSHATWFGAARVGHGLDSSSAVLARGSAKSWSTAHCGDACARKANVLARGHITLIGECHSNAALDRAHRVVAVGVEREQREIVGLARKSTESLCLAAMLDGQNAAAVLRWQNHYERGDHVVIFLGVLMGLEELTFLVEKQFVERAALSSHPSGKRENRALPGAWR